MSAEILLIEEALPPLAAQFPGLRSYQVPVVWDEASRTKLRQLFPQAQAFEAWSRARPLQSQILVRTFLPGVSNPIAQTLAGVLDLDDIRVRVEGWIVSEGPFPDELRQGLLYAWREPAIEEHRMLSLPELAAFYQSNREAKARRDDSWDTGDPAQWGLEFEAAEAAVLRNFEKTSGRALRRAEWELFAQTWSEHCKHKIFAADISAPGSSGSENLRSLFNTYIRTPALEQAQKNPQRFLSLFHDNSGAIALDNVDAEATDYAICAKMETHNSPSAISPYGGASTGLVGVHRDILGTGQGAMPIANWNVLCFEDPNHHEPRPSTALAPDIIRLGVIRGIEDGGNQSGIPTVQGSVVFDPAYAIKPLVYAGSIGLLPKKYVNKAPRAGQKLYCFGGAVGADGLRGAVMSSRDIRSDDFSGSMVQVANAFVQRRVTDFLLEARDQDLLDVVTDNGAGGLASSVGEMASLTGGAQIDLTHLRLKFSGLLAWERLLSESQERMTVATASPEKLEALAKKWGVPFDLLGELNDSQRLLVTFEGQTLVDLPLDLLHEGCPRLKLSTRWDQRQENEFIAELEKNRPLRSVRVSSDFPLMLASPHLCSRKNLVRRFDHEVQGRTRRLPFAGLTQSSPQDASLVECYEVAPDSARPLANRSNLVLAHGLAPWRKDIAENVVSAFDEALRQVLLAGGRWETLAALDNFCWPDPLRHDQRLWWLVRANEILALLTRRLGIPFVSGKDSMKNNSKDFAVPPTLVISLFGSGRSALQVPAGFFARPNDVIYALPPLHVSLRDSAWERIFGVRSADARESYFAASSAAEQDQKILEACTELESRYRGLASVIESGRLRSAKDISEGGLLTALFEMGLGRGLGCDLCVASSDARNLLGEGLGGFVLAVDPHYTSELEKHLPSAKRMGVVIRYDHMRFTDGTKLSLSELKKIYGKRGNEGFWG